ncbi:MAG TPA: M28 family peptidase [Bryobacteraceae bacterium]|nr:M28 family peptidase [Bryobacteraceae bacterium]
MRFFRITLFFLAAISFAVAQIDPETQAALDRISADSLRGRLSFLASDLLEGRGTPSRGLDIAAEYIASEFRGAGLEPAGDDGYFQDANVRVLEQNPENFEFTVTSGDKKLVIDPSHTSITPERAIELDNVPASQIRIIQGRGPVAGNARLVLIAGRIRPNVTDPESGRRDFVRNFVDSPDLVEFLKNNPDAKFTIHVSPAIEKLARVRNVAGLLRGSDPKFRDTYVLLTAHYDHLGQGFDGANDDGSGTVSVIEIAKAIASMNPHPKRSILFLTFFGEERGLLGSRFYGRHPLEPVSKTVADLNLEQVGRTDSTEGPEIANASITGFDYSDLPKILAEAGKSTGIKVYKDPKASDPYFARSDNQALADLGVPAHTLCVAFDYPDYHGTGDHWEKVDYDNMAKVDRAVAVGLLRLASDAPPPKWNESNPGAKRYVEAARKLREQLR